LLFPSSFQIEAIRQIDDQTPIIIEPTYWAQSFSLESFDWFQFVRQMSGSCPARVQQLSKSCPSGVQQVSTSNVFLSVHFYEPQRLTFRHKNLGEFEFPGPVPVYTCPYSETVDWDEKMLQQRVEWLQQIAKKNNVG
jgi:hypothetical protein